MSAGEAPFTVVLLHGLARGGRSMARLQGRIEDAGFPTWCASYPSRHLPLPDLTAWLRDRLRADLGERPVAAVTHSLGGVLARHLHPDLDWQRVVMLAPPNQGSRVAAGLRDWALFRRGWGPAGQAVAAPDDWPPVPPNTAIIAGTAGATLSNPPSLLVGALGLLRGVEHDGTVAVDEARVEGADFATVDASHTWIMNHPRAVELTLRFLRDGQLEPLDR